MATTVLIAIISFFLGVNAGLAIAKRINQPLMTQIDRRHLEDLYDED